MTIGKFAVDLMVNTSMTNEEVLRQIKIKYPESKTGMNSIYWYRSKLNKGKINVKSETNKPQGRWVFVEDQMELKL